jgi:hypothetical protein
MTEIAQKPQSVLQLLGDMCTLYAELNDPSPNSNLAKRAMSAFSGFSMSCQQRTLGHRAAQCG